jgi:DNA-binding response OmpR family regulator
LCDYLDKQNFRVSPADSGVALRRLLERELPALVLLDVGLPGEDGFALARWLREKSGRIGIIMVTAASDTVDRVVGLETGADDYIGKPYEPRELLARIKSVLRRSTGAPATSGPRVRMGRRVLDLEKRVLADPADGSEETLTASEFDLLKLFAENPNRPLQRDWLLESAAHREMEAFDRAIDLRITPAAPQNRGRSGASRRDPHRTRRRLYVRAAQGLRKKGLTKPGLGPMGVEPKGFPSLPMQARYFRKGA